jgi:L-malate glycosyltransferase
MHVLILPVSFPRFYKPVSGIFFRDQALSLARHGITVGLIDPAPRALRTLLDGRLLSTRFNVTITSLEGVAVVQAHDWTLPFARRFYAKHFVWRAMDLFRRYAARFGVPDVIHGHELIWAGAAARAISERFAVPYVVTEHSGDYGLFDTVQSWHVPHLRAAIRGASSMMAVSSDLIRLLQPFADGRPMRVMPNIVDTDFFSPPSEPRADKAQFVFVSIAWLIMDKGIHVLLRAFAAAFKGDRAVCLELGGDGEDRASFVALANELGIGGQVKWLGRLSRAQVRDCLHAADAFVLASRYESFGLVLAEAMSTGLPVISTRAGGPEDFVDESNGALVDVGQVDQLAEAMIKMHRERDHWRRQAAVIRRSVVERCSPDAVVRQLRAVYAAAHERERGIDRTCGAARLAKRGG